jgi:hypothetical protein
VFTLQAEERVFVPSVRLFVNHFVSYAFCYRETVVDFFGLVFAPEFCLLLLHFIVTLLRIVCVYAVVFVRFHRASFHFTLLHFVSSQFSAVTVPDLAGHVRLGSRYVGGAHPKSSPQSCIVRGTKVLSIEHGNPNPETAKQRGKPSSRPGQRVLK